MAQIEIFERGIHARPFSTELNAYNGTLGAEWDYGGVLTHALLSTAVADLYPVKIVDLSYWQGDIDFAKLATKAQGVIIRALYGNKSIDPRLDGYYRGAKDNNLAIMLYHYMKPDLDWEKHALNMIAVEKDYPALEIWGDLEENGGKNKALLESWIFKYFGKVLEHKSKTGIYSSKYFLDTNLGLTNWLKNLDLWIASWTTGATPAMPREFTEINNPKTWKLWQWSSKGDGTAHGVSSRYVDLNRYNGSVAEFNSEYGTNIKPLSEPTPPPPPPDPEPIPEFPKIVETTTALNIRTSPGVLTTNKIGAVVKGTKFEAVGVSSNPDWLKVIAYLHKGYVK